MYLFPSFRDLLRTFPFVPGILQGFGILAPLKFSKDNKVWNQLETKRELMSNCPKGEEKGWFVRVNEEERG